MMNEIEVFVGGDDDCRRAGVLRPSFMGSRNLASSSFEYDEAWAQDGWQISPDLPLRRGRTYTEENQTLPGAFADAAPDDWGQKLIRADHARRRQGDPSVPGRLGEFDYLLGVADRTRMGALRLRSNATWLSSETGVANIHELDRIVAAAQRYEMEQATDEDIAYLNDVATSPGGARPKANVVTDAGQLAIAKLPHSKDGTIDVERWEHVVLGIASAAGLITPRSALASASEGRAVLITERFDRTADGGRLGYVSARTAFGLGTHDNGSRETYEDFADVIAEQSVAPKEDLREMFGRIALTVLVNNVDDHWRNHGFLRDDSGWRLSPLFDVNPSRQRGVIDSRPVSSADDPSDRQLRNLLGVASSFALRDVEARNVIVTVARAVSGWEEAAARSGIERLECEHFRHVFESEQLEWALRL